MKLISTLVGFILLYSLIPHSSCAQKSKHAKRLTVLDTSVSGFRYHNVITVYDSLRKASVIKTEPGLSNLKHDYTLFELSNNLQTEHLQLTLVPAAETETDTFYTVKVNPVYISKKSVMEATEFEHFVTENGIYLGMSFDDFYKRYSRISFDKIQLGEFDIYRFYGDPQIDPETDNVTYNYIALYKFCNNMLMEFLFGRYDKFHNYMRDIMNGNALYLKYKDVTQY
jgi:outer membrane lipoprotein-sorting protein